MSHEQKRCAAALPLILPAPDNGFVCRSPIVAGPKDHSHCRRRFEAAIGRQKVSDLYKMGCVVFALAGRSATASFYLLSHLRISVSVWPPE
jgi:hypothetical protein